MTTTIPTLEQIDALRKDAAEATSAYWSLENEVSRLRSQMRSEANQRIDAELRAIYGERLSALSLDIASRQNALTEAANARAAAAADAKMPVGQIMVRWMRPRYARGQLHITDERGVVEVITKDSEHPGKWCWRRAAIGETVIRLLTKTGKKGKRYERGIYDGSFTGWYPEGVNPNEKEDAQ